MNILESVQSAIANVFANKMRALLTMLGIIIGVGSVITITSIGTGSTAQIEEQFESMGIGNLTVQLTSAREALNADQLTLSDVDLLGGIEEVKYISPVYNGNNAYVKLLDPTETKSATVTGVNEQYDEMNSYTLLYGSFITANNVNMASNVAVVTDTTASVVFGYCDESVIGKKITLKTWRSSAKYTVIGVIEDPNSSMAEMYGDDYPAAVYMPITTAMRYFIGNYLSSIMVTGADPNNLDALSVEITSLLSEAHNNTDKYYVQNIASILDQVTSVMSTVTVLISAVAAISLLVGGIGVMNIMLVTVTERTREIGIRKSIGAKNKDIRMQFIIEAIILTGIGGMIGVLLGWGGGSVAGSYMGISTVISPMAVFIAVGISTAIGIIFGVYPANKAAKLDPIEALRYE